MDRKQKRINEMKLEVLELLQKEPDISISEIARRMKVTRVTARKYRNEIVTELRNKLKEYTEKPVESFVSNILHAFTQAK